MGVKDDGSNKSRGTYGTYEICYPPVSLKVTSFNPHRPAAPRNNAIFRTFRKGTAVAESVADELSGHPVRLLVGGRCTNEE